MKDFMEQLDNPDKDGYWYYKAGQSCLRAFVTLSKQEVYLPTSEHPYNLSALPNGKWEFVSKERPDNW